MSTSLEINDRRSKMSPTLALYLTFQGQNWTGTLFNDLVDNLGFGDAHSMPRSHANQFDKKDLRD